MNICMRSVWGARTVLRVYVYGCVFFVFSSFFRHRLLSPYESPSNIAKSDASAEKQTKISSKITHANQCLFFG